MKLSACFLFFLFCCLLINNPPGWPQQPENRPLPSLSFVDMLQDTVSYPIAADGHPLLLLYFHPDCPECVQTIRRIKQNEEKYPVSVWLISAAPISQLQVFESMLGLYQTNKLKVLQDYSGAMHEHFDFKWLPFIVLLDGQGIPITTFTRLPTPEMIDNSLAR